MAFGALGGGAGLFSGLVSTAIIVFLLLVVLVGGGVGAIVIAVVANRARVDPSGRRPFGVYVFATAFVSLFAAIGSSFVLVASLVRLIGRHDAFYGPGLHPFGDMVARNATLAGFATIAAGALATFYLRKGAALVRDAGMSSTPIARVAQSYAGAVSFLAILIGLVAVISAAYICCQLIAPGVFLGAGRTIATRRLIDALYLVALMAAVIVGHRRLLPPIAQRNPPAPAPEAISPTI